MQENKFKLAEISKQFLAKTENIYNLLLNKSEFYKDLVTKTEEELKKLKQNTKIVISFVGQYSVGKSSIISILTNQEIAVGAGQVTSFATEYDWNGITIIDTPGINTGIKPEHDKETEQAINKSDLTVYVITNLLFDDISIAHFLHFAYDRDCKQKIFLLINKSLTTDVEYNTLINNYKNSLYQIFSSRNRNINDFKYVFIDTTAFSIGKANGSQILVEFSMFNLFIEELNKFSFEKGLYGKLDTQLLFAIDKINEIIAGIGDKADKEFFIILKRCSNELEKGKRKIILGISLLLSELKTEIVNQSLLLSSHIGEDDFEKRVDDIQKSIGDKINETVDKIQKIFDTYFKEIQNNFETLFNNEMSDFFFNKEISFEKINNKYNINNSSDFANKFNRYKDILSTIAFEISKSTLKDATKTTKLFFPSFKEISGSTMHTIVKEVGQFFGKSFKPYEALKFADKIGKFATGIGVAGILISIGLEIKGEIDENKRNTLLESAKKEFINVFSKQADKIVNSINQQTNELIKNSIDNFIIEIENRRIEEEKNISDNTSFKSDIIKYRNDLQNLRKKLDV